MNEINSNLVGDCGTSSLDSPGGASSGVTKWLAVGLLGLACSGVVPTAIASPSTSANYLPIPTGEVRSTSSGDAGVVAPYPGRELVQELRATSGLTWDQLGRLLNVSRRSVHLWANGGAVTPANEEHMARVLAALRSADRGSPSENRAALLSPSAEGVVPFDLLAAMRYEAAQELLAATRTRVRVRLTPLAEEEFASRLPSPPERLVGAIRETGQAAATKTRVAKARRTKDRGER